MSKKFNLLAAPPESIAGGEIRRANKHSFPALKGLALQSIVLQPGAKREAHLHPNAAQMDFVVSGRARVGIVGQKDDVEIHEVSEGDVTYIPTGFIHWIENTSDAPTHFLLILANDDAHTIEIPDVLKVLP